MGQVLRGSARTTAVVRRAIQRIEESLRALVRRHGVNQKTIIKWRKRTSTADLPTGSKDPRSTSLSIEEEAVAASHYRAPHQVVAPPLLAARGISRLPDVEGDRPAKKKFEPYPIGYFHIDIAEVSTAEGKLYLYVAIDRTCKFAPST